MADTEALLKKEANFCFWIAVSVNFVDQLWQFTAPISVPFGKVIGADLKTIALFMSIRGFGGLLSNIWLPWVADGCKGGKPKRRLALLLSVTGCTVGYFIQGLAITFKPGAEAAHVHMVGRFLTGMFTGMGPVIGAFIAEISQGDGELLANRFKYFQLSNTVCGLCFGPLAGIIASCGIEIPFYVAGGFGLITLLLAFAYFKEASELVPKAVQSSTPDTPVAEAADSSSAPVNAKAVVEGNPYCDPVTWLIAIAGAFVFLAINGYEMFMPTLISQPSFGIPGETVKAHQQHVATATGLLSLPCAFTMIFAIMTLFEPVRTRFGDIPSVLVGGTLAGACLATLGFIDHGLWILAILNAILGLCMGTIAPTPQTWYAGYAYTTFPTQQAIAQGIPAVAGQACLLFSQNIMAAVISDFNIQVASLYLGACFVGNIFAFGLAALIAQRSEPSKLSEKLESLLA